MIPRHRSRQDHLFSRRLFQRHRTDRNSSRSPRHESRYHPHRSLLSLPTRASGWVSSTRPLPGHHYISIAHTARLPYRASTWVGLPLPSSRPTDNIPPLYLPTTMRPTFTVTYYPRTLSTLSPCQNLRRACLGPRHRHQTARQLRERSRGHWSFSWLGFQAAHRIPAIHYLSPAIHYLSLAISPFSSFVGPSFVPRAAIAQPPTLQTLG